jgi:metal-responsive CopG/Arc/MetJ family transcriptional regulator
MKTAISLPDDLYADAERLAGALKVSRSRLYSLALREYVSRHAPDHVTEALDSLFAADDTGHGTFAAQAAQRTLRDSEW